MTDKDDTLVGWKGIAAALGVSTSTARRWTREIGLPAYKLGGQVRASRAELGKWIRERRRGVGRRPGPRVRRAAVVVETFSPEG